MIVNILAALLVIYTFTSLLLAAAEYEGSRDWVKTIVALLIWPILMPAYAWQALLYPELDAKNKKAETSLSPKEEK